MIMYGIIQHNKGRGEQMGFPTANIAVSDKAQDGIYVGWTVVDGVRHASLIFIGAAITFGETERRVEVYILDFDQDIYSKEIGVELLKKIRDNQKFASPEKLVLQMRDDERVAREFFLTEDPSAVSLG